MTPASLCLTRVAPLLLMLGACSAEQSTAPLAAADVTAVARLGILVHYFDKPHIDVPEAAKVGEPIIIRVRTYGGGCIAKGTMQVRGAGMSRTLVPVDYHTVNLPAGAACASYLATYTHEAEVTFARPGTAIIRVLGIEEPGARPRILVRHIRVR